MKVYELNVGDKIELRDGLKNHVVTPEMISKVNDRKVKFTGKGFEYTIEGENVMIDPKSLVQSGDFVVYKWKGVEYTAVAIQRGSKMVLAHYPIGWIPFDNSEIIIKKVYRHDEGSFGLEDEFQGKFSDVCGKIIYDSERDSVKEVTMEDVEKKFGCKVKIIKEN